MGSSRGRRSPRNARRNLDADWDKTPSPPPSIRSPGGTLRAPHPLTQRAWVRRDASPSPSIPEEPADESGQRRYSPVSDAPSKELLPGWDRPAEESSDESSYGSIGSNIVVASRRMMTGRRMTRADEDRIRRLLDHENIDLQGDDWVAHQDTPDENLVNAGTLESLIRNRKNGLQFLTDKKPFALPEMLCWHVLRSLLRVMCYLHTGTRDVNDNHVDPNWQPIVHNDINPTNIRFHARHTVRCKRAFKVCKLRNFSRCVVLPRPWRPHDPANEETAGDRREAFAVAGNRRVESGYEAPEFGNLAEVNAPSPACDLWSIGAVLVAMMTTRTIWDIALEKDFVESSKRPRRRRDVLPERWRKVNFTSRVRIFNRIGNGKLTRMLPEHYGDHLRMIVDALLSYNPSERGPTLEVWRNVEALYVERRRQLDHDSAPRPLSNLLA